MTSTNPRSILPACVALGIAQCFVAPVLAQDGATRLDEVVVTATRTAQTQDDTLAAVTVITRADIERLQPASLPDLLRGLPGVSLSNNGGPGKQTSLFLRGTESDHVLFLVDGMKVGSATAGLFSLQDIPVEQIERVEVVRGPFSSLYGSEAIGGVVQVFTRKPQGVFAPNASLTVGSAGLHRESVGFGGRGTRGWGSVSLAHEESDGIDACRGYGFPLFVGCYADQPDLDGYRNDSMALRGGLALGERGEAEVHALNVDARVHYDGFYNEAASEQQAYGARARLDAGDAVALTASVGRSADLTDNFSDGAFMGSFDTRRDQASLQADIRAGQGLVTVGYDWLRDRVDSTEAFPVTERRGRALFGQWQRSFGKHALQASARRDDDSQFGGKTTGSLLWGWDATDALRFTASAGTGYKAPTFNDLYFPFSGNPDLRPESSRSAELGVRGTHGDGGWSASVFDTRIDDLIVYDPGFSTPEHPYGAPRNIDRARVRGAELGGHVDLAGWRIAANATWLHARNLAPGGGRDTSLPRRAPRSARIDVDRRWGNFGVGATAFGASSRFDDVANRTRLSGYGTADLRFDYAFATGWSLQLAARNVFDKRYETAAYYNQPGREWQATLRYSP